MSKVLDELKKLEHHLVQRASYALRTHGFTGLADALDDEGAQAPCEPKPAAAAAPVAAPGVQELIDQAVEKALAAERAKASAGQQQTAQ